jgi:nucleotide-binding universal stress UspA family protein
MTNTGPLASEPLASADGPQEGGRIVVGVDGSQGSLDALRWAFGEARARQVPVHAVFAWQYYPPWADPGLGSMFPLGYQPEVGAPEDAFAHAATSVESLLAAAVRKAGESDPRSATDPVRITQEAVEGHAAQILLDSVSADDLLVVGSHGHGGFIGTLLGSISQHVVSHSRCPVVVVPAPQRTARG